MQYVFTQSFMRDLICLCQGYITGHICINSANLFMYAYSCIILISDNPIYVNRSTTRPTHSVLTAPIRNLMCNFFFGQHVFSKGLCIFITISDNRSLNVVLHI